MFDWEDMRAVLPTYRTVISFGANIIPVTEGIRLFPKQTLPFFGRIVTTFSFKRTAVLKINLGHEDCIIFYEGKHQENSFPLHKLFFPLHK